MIPPTTEASSSPIPTLSTTPPKPRCFGQSLNLPISREQFLDKKLQGHVMWINSVLSEVQCEDLCLRVPGCLAYNYHYSGGKGQKSCELMNEVAVVMDISGYCFRLFERERALKVSICHLFRWSVLLTTPNLRRPVGPFPYLSPGSSTGKYGGAHQGLGEPGEKMKRKKGTGAREGEVLLG